MGADTYPPLKSQLKLPKITVFDDDDRTLILPAALDEPGKPLFLVPVFTKCKMSCPLLVKALRGSLDEYRDGGGAKDYRVLIFTFDSTDTSADLRAFRAKQQIPASWLIVRSPDQGAVRAFFDQFSFSIMSSDGGFIHPNEIFVFNGHHTWVGSLLGSRLSKGDISYAMNKAGDSGIWLQTLESISHPETLIVIGAIGFLATLMLLLGWIWRNPRAKRGEDRSRPGPDPACSRP